MILVWCNSKQDRKRVVMLVTKAPSNSTTKHLFLIHHFSTFCDNHLNPAKTGFLPVSLLRYFLSLPISLMTWGGLTTMCILPAAYLHELPKKQQTQSPTVILPANTAECVCWIAGGVGVIKVHPCMSNCGSGNHVCPRLIIFTMFEKKKKIISIYEFINLKQSLSLWIHSFSSDHSEFFAAVFNQYQLLLYQHGVAHW